MTLAEVVRFMKLDNELTEEEFYGSFCKSIGRELIVSLLYEHFKNNLDAAKHAADIQSKIVNKRKKIEDQPSTYDCIDQLPSELISECGSFLHFKEYFHFGHCNRNIYYSLYSPSKIYEIASYDIQDCDDLVAFKNVKNLRIDIDDYDNLTPANKATWKNNELLQKLIIFTGNDSEIDRRFMQHLDLINNVNVKELTIKGCLTKDVLFKMLSRFGNIEQLEFIAFDFTDDVAEEEKWTAPFQNLIHLNELRFSGAIDAGSEAPNLILAAVSDKVESLTFHFFSGAAALTFPKLRRLDLWWRNWEDCSPYDDLNSLQHLKLHILSANNPIDPRMFRVIANQKDLKTLVLKIPIDRRNDWSTPCGILKNIETALIKYEFGSLISQRLSITLQLEQSWCHWGGLKDANKELGLCVFRVVNALGMFKATEWKLQISCVVESDIKTLKLDALDSLRRRYSVQYGIIGYPAVLNVTVETQ